MSRIIVTLLLVIAMSQLLSAQQAQIRAKLDMPDSKSTYIGEKVSIVVELLVPGYFASAATFDLPDPPGLILMPPVEHPIVSSEDQSGTSFTVQRHEIWAFPERSGRQTIPPFKVRFAFKKSPLDKQDVAAEVQSQPLELDVVKPPGAKDLGIVISARNLKAEETWKPELIATAKAGDAFTRSIEFTGQDVPGSIFPPFPVTQIDGLGIYSKQQVLDAVERGQLNGRRQTNITYVCKRPGHYVLPSVKLSWWDLDSNSLQAISFPAHSFEVIAAQQGRGDPKAASNGISHALTNYTLYLITALFVASLIAWLIYRYSILIKRSIERMIEPFRLVHLEPLNPEDGSS